MALWAPRPSVDEKRVCVGSLPATVIWVSIKERTFLTQAGSADTDELIHDFNNNFNNDFNNDFNNEVSNAEAVRNQP